MIDQYGRNIEYVRVSVTENCNLSCIYCKPGKEAPGDAVCSEKRCNALRPQDFEAIVRAMVHLGISKVRITGGEPLTRPDLCEIIGCIAAIPGIEDLSMTTNGINLESQAAKLKEAGLMRLNISMDSLIGERFSYITGGGRLERVMGGVRKALEVGLTPIKLNTVLIRGINEDEIDNFILLAKDDPIEVRFIELMPIGPFGEENTKNIIYNSEIIASHPELVPDGEDTGCQPARYYRIAGFKGRVGFISPMSHKFCDRCNRIRLTCDGKLKPCLGNNGEADIKEALGAGPEKLEAQIRQVIYGKPKGHNFGNSFTSDRNMSRIGG